MNRCILILCVFLLILSSGLATGKTCSTPDINLQKTVVKNSDLTQDQARALNIVFATSLRDNNQNVNILTSLEVGNILEQEARGLADPGERNIAVQSFSRAGYIISVNIAKAGSRYVLTASLLDTDNWVVVSKKNIEATSQSELEGAAGQLAVSMGDLSTLIASHEIRYPTPPRDPEMELTLDPLSVSVEEGKDTCEVAVKVINCKGEVVEGTKVFFSEYNDRGMIIGGQEGNMAYPDHVYVLTDSSGVARVTYKLDVSKGKAAGLDTVEVFTMGRGAQKVSMTTSIPIRGVYLEAFVEEAEISTHQDTQITVSLFEMDARAQKVPLADRSLFLETFRLSNDVNVIPLGRTDSDGNPITDSTGKIELKFIAGKNEKMEMFRILFQDVSTGYPDAVEEWVEIKVRDDEYRITISWKENGEWYHYITGYPVEELESDYVFSYNSKTIWDKYSGREKTDASFSYIDHEEITYGVDVVDLWTIDSSIQGSLKDYESVNSIAQERFNSYYIPLLSLPVKIPATGEVELTVNEGGPYGYEVSDSFHPLRTKAVSHIPLLSVPPNPVPEVNAPQSEWENWLGIKELTRLKLHIDGCYSTFNDPDMVDHLQLEEVGQGVYRSSWSYDDTFYYEGSPVFFGILTYWESMEVEGSISRDVSLEVMKI